MKTLCLLFGGASSEYEVSLCSAAGVLRALDPLRFRALCVGISRRGEWFLTQATPCEIENDEWQAGALPCGLSPNPAYRGLLVHTPRGLRRYLPDVIFPVLHGGAGEDGRLQGLLSLSGIPFVGCDTRAAALAMDKAVAKVLAREAGVPVLPWLVYDARRDTADDFCARAEAAFPYPMFAKPVAGGSSVGAGRAGDRTSLIACLQTAAREGGRVLVEPCLPARELEIAVLERKDGLELSPVGEICLSGGSFYDYDTKYKNGRATLCEKADIPPLCDTRVRQYAEKVFFALGCRGLARIDFFLDPACPDKPIFNEINTLPGFTADSMFPRLLTADRTPAVLLDLLIEGAMRA